jgi:hypothetical protein
MFHFIEARHALKILSTIPCRCIWDVKIQFHAFWISARNGIEWSASRLMRKRLMVSRDGLDVVAKKFLSLSGIEVLSYSQF